MKPATEVGGLLETTNHNFQRARFATFCDNNIILRLHENRQFLVVIILVLFKVNHTLVHIGLCEVSNCWPSLKALPKHDDLRCNVSSCNFYHKFMHFWVNVQLPGLKILLFKKNAKYEVWSKTEFDICGLVAIPS